MLVEGYKKMVDKEELHAQLFNTVIQDAKDLGVTITDEYKKVVHANLTAAIHQHYDKKEFTADA